jgi:hypothetical protein
MAANEPLNQLSTTDASNTPAGSDVIGSSLDDELRSIKANIARSGREESTATASAAATLAVTVLNKIVPVSGSAAGSTTITLPAAATAGAGFRFTAWKTDNTNNVIIDANGSETINGGADYTMATQYEAAQFVTDGTSWIVESTAKREIGTSDLADDSVTLAKMEHGTSGDVLYYGASGAPTRLAKGTDGQVLGLASGIPAWQEEAARTPYGFYTTRASSSTIDIAEGACWDTTRAVWIEGSALTKDSSATWSVGNLGGFLDTGTQAGGTGYHFYCMISDVDGSVDYIASTSPTWAGVTKPTNYTKGQLIGFGWSVGAPDWSVVHWSGDFGLYESLISAIFDTTMVDLTYKENPCAMVPHNCAANFTMYYDNPTATNDRVQLYVKYADGTLGTPAGVADSVAYTELDNSSDVLRHMVNFTFAVNGSQEIAYACREISGSASIRFYVKSFWLAERLERVE